MYKLLLFVTFDAQQSQVRARRRELEVAELRPEFTALCTFAALLYLVPMKITCDANDTL